MWRLTAAANRHLPTGLWFARVLAGSSAAALLLLSLSCGSTEKAETVEKYTAQLSSPIAAQRVAAMVKLGDMGARAASAVPLLIDQLDDREEVVIEVSQPVGSGKVSLIMSKTLVHEQAEIALGKIGEPAIKPLLAAVAARKNTYWAIRALRRIGPPAVEPLVGLYRTERDERVRCDVVEQLGGLNDVRARDVLVAALKDASVYIREKAADALQESSVADLELMGVLIDTLGDSSGYVRDRALRALEQRAGRSPEFSYDQRKWRTWLAENQARFTGSSAR